MGAAAARNREIVTAALAAAFGLAWAFTDVDPTVPSDGPWWMYLGGVVGLAFIAIASWVVPIVGVLYFALTSIAGQLSGALLLDVFAPTAGTDLAWNLVVGVLVAFGAVGFGQGLVIPTGIELIMTSASADQAGSAAGVNETIVEAGGALGVAAMGSVLVARRRSESRSRLISCRSGLGPVGPVAILAILDCRAAIRYSSADPPLAFGATVGSRMSSPGTHHA